MDQLEEFLYDGVKLEQSHAPLTMLEESRKIQSILTLSNPLSISGLAQTIFVVTCVRFLVLLLQL